MSPPNTAALILNGEEIIRQYARLIIQCLHWDLRHFHTVQVYHDLEMELQHERWKEAERDRAEGEERIAKVKAKAQRDASLLARRKELKRLRPLVRRRKISIATLRNQMRTAGTKARDEAGLGLYYRGPYPFERAGWPPKLFFTSTMGDGELREWAELLDCARERRGHKYFVPLRLVLWFAEAEERCEKARQQAIQREAVMMPGIKKRYLKLRGR